ncbi:hypothetical protein BC332_32081 [Capsicum chinense]|uniref:Peptidase S9 prolyl oligopeptidase catalytic domain-containing protein n=1 Tax=Capsicum annuum TaxID=4072 RepID=A0A2G2ZBI5_CAPAN|nr:hypothetical protein T459_17323 [Capsicum annuum]PHT98933.1 hypothetical protein BC332_32081 [Capsicum chinense]
MRLLLLQTGGVSKGRSVAQGQLIKIQLLATFRVQIDAAIDHVIGKGLENPSKITVVGLSHGGFLMTYLIGQAPDNFAAAAARNPVCNPGLMVARDSVNDGDESLNAIDIPSPRPKKKPLHRYPRKMVDSLVANKAVSGQPESSPSPNVSGRKSRSPDSVLLAIGSGVSEYPVSEQQNSRFSPAYCTTDVHTSNIISAENDDESMTSNSSTVEEIHV